MHGPNHQLNYGALHAKAEVLFFVHADCIVPPNYNVEILKAVSEKKMIGCFRLKFKTYPNPFLYINSNATRFQGIWLRGGDQSLFIDKKFFMDLGGYHEDACIMEEYILIEKAKKNS